MFFEVEEVPGSSCDPLEMPEFQKTVHLTLGGENDFALKLYPCADKLRATGPEGLLQISGPCLCLCQSRFNLNRFCRFEWSVSAVKCVLSGFELRENENNSLSETA